jgi:hypothetical protein
MRVEPRLDLLLDLPAGEMRFDFHIALRNEASSNLLDRSTFASDLESSLDDTPSTNGT